MSTPESSTPASSSAQQARDLAEQERVIAGKMDLGGLKWPLLGTIALFIVSLLLPFASGANGLEILLYTESSRDAGVKITENVFVWTGTLGLVIFGLITVLTRRSTPFILAWALTTIALIEALLALWLRQTSQGYGSAAGIYLAILAVVVAEVLFILLATHRNPEQEAIARCRQQLDDTDVVGQAQRSASQRANESAPLYDDRRAQAAKRHQRLADEQK